MSRWRELWTKWRARRSGRAVQRAPSPAVTADATPACSGCMHFRNDPAEMEAAIPGLASFSSGFASVRGDDGLCLKHDRFVTAGSSCGLFKHRQA